MSSLPQLEISLQNSPSKFPIPRPHIRHRFHNLLQPMYRSPNIHSRRHLPRSSANPVFLRSPQYFSLLCIFLVLKLWLNRIIYNQNLVREIYLLENGEATEIWFANRKKRRLFGEEEKKVYYNSLFVEPDYEK